LWLHRIFAAMDFPKLMLEQWPLLLFILLCVVLAIQLFYYLFFFTQLFYYLFFFTRLAFYKSSNVNNTQTHAVSVVVCARDEAANLAKNLPGILVQDYPTTHEVVVVNDNSYDDSRYVLEELKKEFKQMNVVELTQEAKMIPGKKFPLSIGIKSAKHELLLLTDADCVPGSENWISSMQNAYNNNTEIVLGYGPFHKKNGLLNKLIRWETFHTGINTLGNLSYCFAIYELCTGGYSIHGRRQKPILQKSCFYKAKRIFCPQ